MAKKYNRSRPQKRNIDRRKLEQYREEIARELGVELPKKRESVSARDTSPRINLRRTDDNPLC